MIPGLDFLVAELSGVKIVLESLDDCICLSDTVRSLYSVISSCVLLFKPLEDRFCTDFSEISVCFTLRVILQGFVTQNATWCQNSGCICISSTRRTYGRIHMLPVIQTSTIILWTELFPKKRREKIQGEILQSIFEYKNYKKYSISTRSPATPSNSAYRINSSTRIPRNTTTTRLFPCRLLPATVPRVSKHSTRQNKASGPPYSIPRPYSTSRLPVILPGRNSILHGSQHPRSPYSSSQASSTEFYQEK